MSREEVSDYGVIRHDAQPLRTRCCRTSVPHSPLRFQVVRPRDGAHHTKTTSRSRGLHRLAGVVTIHPGGLWGSLEDELGEVTIASSSCQGNTFVKKENKTWPGAKVAALVRGGIRGTEGRSIGKHQAWG